MFTLREYFLHLLAFLVLFSLLTFAGLKLREGLRRQLEATTTQKVRIGL